MQDEQFLKAAGAARIIGVGPARVAQLADRGDLPCIRTADGTRLFRRRDVEQFAKARERKRARERDAA